MALTMENIIKLRQGDPDWFTEDDRRRLGYEYLTTLRDQYDAEAGGYNTDDGFIQSDSSPEEGGYYSETLPELVPFITDYAAEDARNKSLAKPYNRVSTTQTTSKTKKRKEKALTATRQGTVLNSLGVGDNEEAKTKRKTLLGS